MTERAQHEDRPERRTRLHRREYFDRVRAELAARLRGVCGAMAPAEFDALVRDMTRLRLKYELGD